MSSYLEHIIIFADALDVTGVEDFAYNLSKYDDITEFI